MWMMVVVIVHPFLRDSSYLYVFKQMSVQHVFPKGLVKSLTKPIFHRFAFLDAYMTYGGVQAKALKNSVPLSVRIFRGFHYH